MSTDLHKEVERLKAETWNRAIDAAAHAIVCTPKYPLSDHDAHGRALERVLALKLETPPESGAESSPEGA